MKSLHPRSGECSCCLKKGLFTPLKSKPSWSKDSTSYVDMLRISLGLQFPENTENLICTSCSIRVKHIHSFHKKVLFANHAIVKTFATKSVSVEVDDILQSAIEETEVRDVAQDEEFDVNMEDGLGALCSVSEEPAEDPESDKEYLSDLDNNIPLSTIPQAKNPISQTVDKAIVSENNLINNLIKLSEGIIDETETVITELARRKKRAYISNKKKGCYCVYCDLIFDSENEKDRHVQNMHIAPCRVCGDKMIRKDLDKHTRIVHGLKCNQCPALFVSRSLRMRHMCEVHKKEMIACPHCDYKCSSQPALGRHLISHKPEKIHHCSFCEKKFPRRSTLRLHERIHTGEKRFLCKLCGERFVQKASLKYHMEKYHPGEI